ncbi:MAG: hypothetical protein ACO1RT_06450 [Planctomycetaceae bacterium]
MRFELNFAAVVRNVAVLANVANLAVVRFVAVVHPVIHALMGTHAPTATGQMRYQSWCGSCQSSAASHMAAMGMAVVAITPRGEITRRLRQESLLSKRRG